MGPNDRGGGVTAIPGRITITCQNVLGLIQLAYVMNANGVRSTNPGVVLSTPIEGGPGWINSERYTISAIAEGNPSRPVMEGPMLQEILEDRFQLKIRRGSRELPIYELTVAKGGAKIKPFVEGSCIRATPPERANPAPVGQRYCKTDPAGRGPNMLTDVEGVTIEEYVRSLSMNPVVGIDRPVVDKTGLTGRFNIRVEFAPPANIAAILRSKGQDPGEPTAPALPDAIEDQLGLILKAVKGSGDYYVIDRVERPSEN